VRIPVFPLPNAALFPGVQAPLHIFEPRYRALTADALAGQRTIGMVTIRPDQLELVSGSPELYPIGCAGTIHRAEALADGRYNIVLSGTRRFRIEEEVPEEEGRLYRVADVTLLEDVLEPADAPRLRAGRHEVVALFSELVRRTNPERSSEITDELFKDVDDSVFTNTFCQLLELEAVEKQSLLQSERVADRCEQLVTLLRFRLVELDGASPDGAHEIH
jgi:Lon protease-like protein